MSKEIIKKFNEISMKLLTDMSSIIGSSYQRKYKMMSKVNSTFFIKKFNITVLKFKSYIKKRDENYFYNRDVIMNELEEGEYSDDDKQAFLEEYEYLSEIYNNIDGESKDNFWDILNALVYLCEKYVDCNKK